MTKIEKTILKDLYESSEGLYPFTFYSRYKIKPNDLFKFIEKYQEKGIINLASDRLLITKEGRDIILKQMFLNKSGSGKFSNIPEEFIISKLGINKPFLPNLKEVSKEILYDGIGNN